MSITRIDELASRRLVITMGLLVFAATAAAQDFDLQLTCKGTVESVGSKFASQARSEVFTLKINRATGKVSGGYADFLTQAETFSSRVTEKEFEGEGSGRTLLPEAFVNPVSFYKIDRLSGSFFLYAILNFPKDQTYVEYRVRGACEPASKKF